MYDFDIKSELSYQAAATVLRLYEQNLTNIKNENYYRFTVLGNFPLSVILHVDSHLCVFQLQVTEFPISVASSLEVIDFCAVNTR